MKIVHIITGLKDGGAENLLYKICKHFMSSIQGFLRDFLLGFNFVRMRRFHNLFVKFLEKSSYLY